MRRFFLSLFVITIIWSAGSSVASAQTNIERISVTERSDEQGFVVRYHLTEMVDSFTVSQPSIDQVQMELYAADMEDADQMLPALTLPQGDTVFRDIQLHRIENGVGVEFTFEPGNYFKAQAYPDQNMRDLLLALEYTSREEVEQIVEGEVYLDWADTEPDSEPVAEETDPFEPDEPQRFRDEVSIQFGVRAGFSRANFINQNYNNEARTEYALGVPMVIDLPVFLNNDIKLGIESGAYYYQKGIQNPPEEFNAETLNIDYIQVPVLARFNYTSLRWLDPHIVVGPYLAFMVSSEAGRTTRRRNDLDDRTNSADLGGVFGVGTDLSIGHTTLNTRLEYSVGFEPVFSIPEDSEEGHSMFSIMVGITF